MNKSEESFKFDQDIGSFNRENNQSNNNIMFVT